jgi:hypothetical protein
LRQVEGSDPVAFEETGTVRLAGWSIGQHCTIKA